MPRLPEQPRDRELFEAGMRALEARHDPDLQLVRLDSDVGTWHSPRESLWYALCLLLTDRLREAEPLIRNVLSMQERTPSDPHRGNFRWLWEDEVVIDLNGVEFVVEELAQILALAGDQLSSGVRDEIVEAIRLGFEEIDRLDVHWTYTNIYLLDVHNSVLAGELIGDDTFVQRGVRRLREWAERTKADGAPHEFNSATYSGVQLSALASIVQHARHEEARDIALEMEQFVWRHVARHFHVPTLQLAGPHSRAYRRDVVGAVDYLKVLLYKVLGEPKLLEPTPYYDGPGREGGVLVSLTEYHLPQDAMELLTRHETREARERASEKLGMELTTYLTPEFALGSMSVPYGVGEPPEVWPGHNSCIAYYVKHDEPGYGVVYCRYVLNDRRIGDTVYESQRSARDLWEEGTFRTAQRGGDAIVAYGLVPRGQRPVHSLRVDVRLLGPDADVEVVIDGRREDGRETELLAGATVGIADGDVYVGIRVLEPTFMGRGPAAMLWKDGMETVLSIYNYEGPPKQFWEYRSLTGPFFKGNVRNGFVLRLAARGEHPSLEEFVRELSAVSLTDDTRDGRRAIAFGDELWLEYDLRELR